VRLEGVEPEPVESLGGPVADTGCPPGEGAGAGAGARDAGASAGEGAEGGHLTNLRFNSLRSGQFARTCQGFLAWWQIGQMTCTRQSASPASLNSLFVITQDPLKRIVPLVALIIGISSRIFGNPRPRRGRRLFWTSKGGTVMVTDIFDHVVNMSILKHFEMEVKLFKKVSITPYKVQRKNITKRIRRITILHRDMSMTISSKQE
jgi:hypothetical protein